MPKITNKQMFILSLGALAAIVSAMLAVVSAEKFIEKALILYALVAIAILTGIVFLIYTNRLTMKILGALAAIVSIMLALVLAENQIEKFLIYFVLIIVALTIGLVFLVYTDKVTTQTFGSVASGIQSIIVSIAIIIGGWWALVEFGISQKLTIGLQVRIEAQEWTTNEGKYFINSLVTISNSGSLGIPIVWVTPPYSIYKVSSVRRFSSPMPVTL